MLNQLNSIIDEYLSYRNNRISLISSENRSSRLLKSMYLLGLSDQYCSRLPYQNVIGNLSFGNLGPLDKINKMTYDSILDLFKAKDCEYRLLSGVNGLTVLLYLLASKKVKHFFKVADSHGGHLSVAPIARSLSLDFSELLLDDTYTLDLNLFEKLYKQKRPEVIMLDSSYVLFPYPLKEIRRIVSDDVYIIYDASHVAGLILAGLFQEPFVEGANIIHSTTHKSIWGPQKSILAFDKMDDFSTCVHDVVKDVLVSNTHLHHILALYVALLEYKHFGKQYAINLQKNVKLLAQSLYDNEVQITASARGFSQSNQFWIQFNTFEEAKEAFLSLEKYNISTNLIFLPFDKWGLRVSPNEISRFCMSDDTVIRLGSTMADIILSKKKQNSINNDIDEIRESIYSSPVLSFNGEEEQNIINKIIGVVHNERC